MINSVQPAANAFLAIWNNLPQPIIALALSVLILYSLRVIFSLLGGAK